MNNWKKKISALVFFIIPGISFAQSGTAATAHHAANSRIKQATLAHEAPPRPELKQAELPPKPERHTVAERQEAEKKKAEEVKIAPPQQINAEVPSRKAPDLIKMQPRPARSSN